MPVCSLLELRARVAATMMEDPVEYLPYLTSPKTHNAMTEEEFGQYCQDIANSPAWGGQVEVSSRVLVTTIVLTIKLDFSSARSCSTFLFVSSPLLIIVCRYLRILFLYP